MYYLAQADFKYPTEQGPVYSYMAWFSPKISDKDDYMNFICLKATDSASYNYHRTFDAGNLNHLTNTKATDIARQGSTALVLTDHHAALIEKEDDPWKRFDCWGNIKSTDDLTDSDLKIERSRSFKYTGGARLYKGLETQPLI